MSTLLEMIADGRQIGPHAPWPRAVMPPDAWAFAAVQLASGAWTLVSLWAEPGEVHLALFDPAASAIGVMSLRTDSGRFPSIGASHLPARRFERTVRDMHGLEPEGSPDNRPWLDHGTWSVSAPLGAPSREVVSPVVTEPYRFLPVEGEGVHQIPVGPVHAGIIEPGHFRFSANGETVVRLEERLGYVHKGIESLLVNTPLDRAAKLAARVSGDSTVAYSTAFAQAVEAACDVEIPSRAAWLRALMLELERIANHLGDIGAVCNDAAFALMHAHCAVIRERVLRAANAAFGHRLMMDRVMPGGVGADIDRAGRKQIKQLIATIRRRFPGLVALYNDTTSLQDRTVHTGYVDLELVTQYGAGGFVGRASGRAFDARKVFPRAPYSSLDFEVPTSDRGDVDTRVHIRMSEIEQSVSLIDRLLDGLPEGETRTDMHLRDAEGMALVEGFRGDIFVWVRTKADGTIARAHLRDPSWLQWPLLEAAIENNIVADFPLCNKSFNCSYAGHDL
ncbi:MAG: NADH-quinone oxidoreductase subunit C [Proteobacteria bacterium]|nr:NADH-quinone oxidoreductase subunit C [Pseudomonadota bacterium]